MFSIDNFLFDHMPYVGKSRSIFDELCDPMQAYWPNHVYSSNCSPRRRCSNQQLYNRWVNCLMDEILDTSKEIEMEVERPEQCKEAKDNKELMEVERCEDTAKPSCSNVVDNCENVNTQKENSKALQLSRPTELSLRLAQYRPEDITCSVKDNRLTIKGKRQRKSPNSYCSQTFERTFTLPKDVDQQNILCTMDKNGLIKLNLPYKKLENEAENEVKEIKIINELSEVNKEVNKEVNEDVNKAAETTVKSVDDEPVVEDLVEE